MLSFTPERELKRPGNIFLVGITMSFHLLNIYENDHPFKMAAINQNFVKH